VPNVWNIDKIDPLLIECFTDNVTDLVLSGYPTENDRRGMRFILNMLTHGHISHLTLKFPSYSLMNILLPLLIYPRSYTLSYLSANNDESCLNSSQFDLTRSFHSFHHRQQYPRLCLYVQIETSDEYQLINPHQFLSATIHRQMVDDSLVATHATRSDASHSTTHDSSDLLTRSPSSTDMQVQTTSVEQERFSQIDKQRISSTVQSIHLITLPNENTSTTR
jgi:hypothetical protein